MSRQASSISLFALLSLLLTSCAVAEDPSADRDPTRGLERPAAKLLEERDDPQPISLPEDAAPHDRLTEWWYYTGHVQDDDGNLYGFEFVIFQVFRGDFPPSYAAHFAVTDTRSGAFHYAERTSTGEQPPGDEPLSLAVDGWSLSGGDGIDQIAAKMEGYALDIRLESEKPPVLHEGDGFFKFAPGAESYYYSRTRMNAVGTLTVDGEPLDVHGNAWFDQQWGDFLVLDDIGWDWFSVQLENDQELMAWQSHDRRGNVLDGNATIVREDGSVVDVPFEDMEIEPTGEWQSPGTDGVYPMGWVIRIPDNGIEISIEPVMEDQELVTLESTGVIYWEGMVTARGSWDGDEVEGLGYVELTGYAGEELSNTSWNLRVLP